MNPTGEKLNSKWNPDAAPRAAWFRLAHALLILGGAAWAVVSSVRQIHQGCMNAFGGFIGVWFIAVPLLVLGVLSAVLAIPLFLKTPGGIKTALVFDGLVGGAAAMTLVISNTRFFLRGNFGQGDLPWRLGTSAFVAAVVLLMAAEAAWLLYAGRGWRGAWRGYAGLAVLMVAMVAWPPLAEYQGLRHVRGVTDYVPGHLMIVPDGTQVHVSRESSPEGGHLHELGFSNPDYAWVFFVQHEGGKLRFRDMGGILFLFRLSPHIRSVAEARELLIQCGVPAGNLGTPLDVRLPMDEPYVIDAPAIGGRYGVETNGCVRLYFVSPPVIPVNR